MSSIRRYINIVETMMTRGLPTNHALDARHTTEKWTREALNSAGIYARVEFGTIWVRSPEDQQRAQQVIADLPGLGQKLPVKIQTERSAA